MTIDLKPHGWPGELLAICGFDGSDKSTLEEALVGAIAPTRPCVAAGAPTEWWRNDAHVRRALFRVGDGLLLPEEALDAAARRERGEFVVGNRYLYDMGGNGSGRTTTAPPRPGRTSI